VELFRAASAARARRTVRRKNRGARDTGTADGGEPCGIEHTALQRGMVLAAPGKFRKTRRIDVRLELLRSTRKMKQGSRVHFHAGTAETIAEVFFHGEKELPPGASAVAN